MDLKLTGYDEDECTLNHTGLQLIWKEKAVSYRLTSRFQGYVNNYWYLN